jgi:hypothetical protein
VGRLYYDEGMTTPILPAWWTSHYGSTPPLGHQLRAAYPDRWLRIHSLPASKRYPESAAELEGLLERHAAVAGELFGPGHACTLLTALYERAEPGTRQILPELGARSFECIAWGTDADEDIDASYWAAESTWDPEGDRAILIAIAEDRLRALWLNRGSGEVYAPYDGGADLFVLGHERRGWLTRKYAEWRSARPDGL